MSTIREKLGGGGEIYFGFWDVGILGLGLLFLGLGDFCVFVFFLFFRVFLIM